MPRRPCFFGPPMLSAIRFLLSPSRLRFMHRYANPAMSELGARLNQFASPQGRPFVATLLRANAEFIRTYLDRGRLGVKSGQGFYDYPDPAYEASGFVESGPGREDDS